MVALKLRHPCKCVYETLLAAAAAAVSAVITTAVSSKVVSMLV
jgi:hypothetical protein